MTTNRIIHSVIFSLKHEKGSAEERRFLEDGRSALSTIPTVQDFKIFKQISPKIHMISASRWCLRTKAIMKPIMSTRDIDFVENRWKKEVEQFWRSITAKCRR